MNVESLKTRNIEYMVKTRSRRVPYVVDRRPIKSGAYYYLSFIQGGNEVRRIQIPETEILEIEYNIH